MGEDDETLEGVTAAMESDEVECKMLPSLAVLGEGADERLRLGIVIQKVQNFCAGFDEFKVPKYFLSNN